MSAIEAIARTPRYVCTLIIPPTTTSTVAPTSGSSLDPPSKKSNVVNQSQPLIVPLFPSVCKSTYDQLQSSSFLFNKTTAENENSTNNNNNNNVSPNSNLMNETPLIPSPQPSSPLSRRNTNELNEQQFGSFSSIPSMPSSNNNNNINNSNNMNNNSGGGTHTSNSLRHAASNSTLASSLSNNSLGSVAQQQSHNHHHHLNRPTSSFQQQHQASATVATGGTSTIASSSNTNTTHATSTSGNTKSIRPLGQLAPAPSNTTQITTSPMKVAFNKYLLVPTVDGKLYVYEIYDFDKIEQQLLECQQGVYQEKQRQRRKAFQMATASTTSFTTLNTTAANNSTSSSTLSRSLSSSSLVHLSSSYHPQYNNNNDIDSFHVKIDAIKNDRCKVQSEKEKVEPIYSIGPFYIGEYYDNVINNKEEVHDSSTIGTTSSNHIPSSIVALCHLTTTTNNENGQYVAILTNEGDVHILRFDSSHHSTVVKPSSSTSILSTTTTSSTSLKQSTASFNTATSGGHDGIQRDHHYHHDVRIEYVTSFFSGHLGAACISMSEGIDREESSSPSLKKGDKVDHQHDVVGDNNVNNNTSKSLPSSTTTRLCHIIIGHDNGMISGFDVLKKRSNRSSSGNSVDDYESKLCWNGKFDDNCSIQSLTFLKYHPNVDVENCGEEPHKEDETVNNKNIARPLQTYIAVGMGQSPLNVPDPFISATMSTSSKSQGQDPSLLSKSQCLEVVNVSSVEMEWEQKFGHVITKKSDVTTHDSRKELFDPLIHWIPFANFTVWPIRDLGDNDDDVVLINVPSHLKMKTKKHPNARKERVPEMFGINMIGKIVSSLSYH